MRQAPPTLPPIRRRRRRCPLLLRRRPLLPRRRPPLPRRRERCLPPPQRPRVRPRCLLLPRRPGGPPRAPRRRFPLPRRPRKRRRSRRRRMTAARPKCSSRRFRGAWTMNPPCARTCAITSVVIRTTEKEKTFSRCGSWETPSRAAAAARRFSPLPPRDARRRLPARSETRAAPPTRAPPRSSARHYGPTSASRSTPRSRKCASPASPRRSTRAPCTRCFRRTAACAPWRWTRSPARARIAASAP